MKTILTSLYIIINPLFLLNRSLWIQMVKIIAFYRRWCDIIKIDMHLIKSYFSICVAAVPPASKHKSIYCLRINFTNGKKISPNKNISINSKLIVPWCGKAMAGAIKPSSERYAMLIWVCEHAQVQVLYIYMDIFVWCVFGFLSTSFSHLVSELIIYRFDFFTFFFWRHLLKLFTAISVQMMGIHLKLNARLRAYGVRIHFK